MGAIRVDKNVEIPMRDGVILRADVWRPDDDRAYPAVIERTPYQKERSVGHDFLRPDQMALAGYVVVTQDTRGRFASDGAWEGFMWSYEGPDSYDTVEWVAAQPWCDGNVGVWGVSYCGMVSWLTAMEKPPHLRAIAPAMTADARFGPPAVGGVFMLELMLQWFVLQIATDVLPKQLADGAADPSTIALITEAVRDPSVVTEYLPVRKSPHLAVDGCPVTIDELLDGDTGTPVTIDLDAVDVPVLQVTGYFDPFASVELHQALTSIDADTSPSHRLVIGPWTHAIVLPQIQGEVNFGLNAAGRLHAPAAHLAFFDRHLKGAEADTAPVRYFLMGANEWRDAAAWPPPDASSRSWYLRSDGDANRDGGRLDTVPGGDDEPPDRYDYDPVDPVRTHGGRFVALGTSVAGPLDQRGIESRPDVLTYTSEPVEHAVDLVGPLVVRLHAATSAPDTDFVAKVTDVGPDGRSLLVGDGLLRASFREGFDERRPVPPGVPQEYAIFCGHTAWRLSPGHRLRVDVASSHFPAFDRNMNTGHPLGADAEGQVASQTIFHDASRPSRLETFVLDGS